MKILSDCYCLKSYSLSHYIFFDEISKNLRVNTPILEPISQLKNHQTPSLSKNKKSMSEWLREKTQRNHRESARENARGPSGTT